MNLFSWLLVGHMVGDFLLQTRWMAEEKRRRWLPLFIHAGVYTLTLTLLSQLAGGLRPHAILLIFFSHVVLDHHSFVHFWTHKVTGSVGIPWLTIMTDQAWHMVFLALALV